jgi:hypothetical protein
MALPDELITFVIGMSLGRVIMRLTSVVTLSAALLLSSTAMAKEKKLASNDQPSNVASYQTQTDATAVAADPAEKKICKSLKVTGTRMFKRSCLTKQQWEQVEEDSK